MKTRTLLYRENKTEYKTKIEYISSGSITLNNRILLMYVNDKGEDVTVVCEHFRLDE